VQLAKNDLASVFVKKLQFSVLFQFPKLTVVSIFQFVFLHSTVQAVFYLCFCGMRLEVTYFRAELVQLIVSQSELVVQRYGMKIDTLSL